MCGCSVAGCSTDLEGGEGKEEGRGEGRREGGRLSASVGLAAVSPLARFFPSPSRSLARSLSLCGRDMRSPQSRGSRVMTRNYTAVSLKEQKKPTLSLEPRDFDTRVRTKSATRSKNYSFMSSLPESPHDAQTRSSVPSGPP